MAAIRPVRQGMIRAVMAGCTGRLNMLSSLIGNLASYDGDAPLFCTGIQYQNYDGKQQHFCFNLLL